MFQHWIFSENLLKVKVNNCIVNYLINVMQQQKLQMAQPLVLTAQSIYHGTKGLILHL